MYSLIIPREQSAMKSKEEMDMEFEIVDDINAGLSVSQVNIKTEDDPERILGVSSSQISIPQNKKDLRKVFGRPYVEIDGKKWNKTEIMALVSKNKELEANLCTARLSNRKLVKEIREEKRKCRIRKEDLKMMKIILNRYTNLH